MFAKLLSSVFVMAVVVGIVAADEFAAALTKVDGDKVTFQKHKLKKDAKKVDDLAEKDGDPVTLPVAKDAKILKFTFGKKQKEPEAIEGGLSNDMFKKIPEKGIFARFVTSDDNKTITKITVFTFGKGK